jgi:hypothetical protein
MIDRPDSVSPGAGSDAPLTSTGGNVEQRLLRIARRRGSTRLHVVASLPLAAAAKRHLAAGSAAAPAAGRPHADTHVSTAPGSTRVHVVVSGRAAGTFVAKSGSTK